MCFAGWRPPLLARGLAKRQRVLGATDDARANTDAACSRTGLLPQKGWQPAQLGGRVGRKVRPTERQGETRAEEGGWMEPFQVGAPLIMSVCCQYSNLALLSWPQTGPLATFARGAVAECGIDHMHVRTCECTPPTCTCRQIRAAHAPTTQALTFVQMLLKAQSPSRAHVV